ncbi:MAG TPA: MBL fold metallo-hydrolase [Candidatus Limnocylindrales bacterium]
MELIVLGAAPAYTDRRGSAASSYLLRAGGANLLLDLGQGSFSNLAATLDPSTLAAVLVSHLHPDHFIDLVPLRHYLKWEFNPPRRVRVAAPATLADRLDTINGEAGFAAEALDIERLAEGVHRFGPFEVEVRRVTHTNESYAFRVAVAGGSAGAGPDGAGSAAAGTGSAAAGAGSAAGLVYSGDCARVDDLVPLIRPGDTVLSEATFGAGPVASGAQHITSGDVARVAAQCGAARLLLTHILSTHSRNGTLASARAAFAGPIQLVTEGDRFEV